jgi:hypothetical protein
MLQPLTKESRMYLIPVSAGELLDKLTILEIKSEYIEDEAKLANVNKERTAICNAALDLPGSEELLELRTELLNVNKELWDIEDVIRRCEKERLFDDDFIALARSVYKYNDRRAAIKRAINELLGSELVEEKSYEEYT